MSDHKFKELAVWQRAKRLAVCLIAAGALGAVTALLLP
jgi:hypothetical protein